MLKSFQRDFVPSPYEKIYLLFKDDGGGKEGSDILLSVYKTPELAMTEGNLYLAANGSTDRFTTIDDTPDIEENGFLYIEKWELKS